MEAMLAQLVETCQEMVKISVNVKGQPEESELLGDLRKTAIKALATRGSARRAVPKYIQLK